MSLECWKCIKIKQCVSADQHAIRFIPKEDGVHSIEVRFNGGHISGSPFKILVGEPGQPGDPALVSAYGLGLERGNTGKHESKHKFKHWFKNP